MDTYRAWWWQGLVYGLLLLGIILLFFLKGPLTGLAVYEETQQLNTWRFASGTGYTFNASALQFGQQGVTLQPQQQVTFWNVTTVDLFSLLFAGHSPKNETTSLGEKDNKKLKKKESEFLDLIFSEPLQAGDVISFLAEGGNAGVWSLCPIGAACATSPVTVSYGGQEGWVALTLPSLDPETRAFRLTSPAVDLQAVNVSRGFLAQAWYAPKDKTTYLSTQNDKTWTGEDDSSLFFVVNHTLAVGDQVSLYLMGGSPSALVLCPYGERCMSPGWGTVSFDGTGGWYNLTVQNLPVPRSAFSLLLSGITLDALQGRQVVVQQFQNTSQVYPASATLETADFSPSGGVGWGEFSSQKEGNVTFSSSGDGGKNWMALASSGSLQSDNHSTLRFRYTLSSGTPIPLLTSFTLSYRSQKCLENWTVDYSSCQVDGHKIKHYQDIHSCGAKTAFPSDNGTAVSCDYCAQENCSEAFSSVTQFSRNVSVRVEGDSARVEIIPQQDAREVEVSLVEYSNHSTPPPPGVLSLQKYVDIETNATVVLQEVQITLPYTEEELTSAGIAEETLKMHFFNETSSQWQELSSTVNSVNNTVTAVVSHMSWYTLYGTAAAEGSRSSSPAPSGGSESSAGSGGVQEGVQVEGVVVPGRK